MRWPGRRVNMSGRHADLRKRYRTIDMGKGRPHAHEPSTKTSHQPALAALHPQLLQVLAAGVGGKVHHGLAPAQHVKLLVLGSGKVARVGCGGQQGVEGRQRGQGVPVRDHACSRGPLAIASTMLVPPCVCLVPGRAQRVREGGAVALHHGRPHGRRRHAARGSHLTIPSEEKEGILMVRSFKWGVLRWGRTGRGQKTCVVDGTWRYLGCRRSWAP